jgi:hypothetical protein
MKAYFSRLGLFLIPVFLVLISYFIFDPFKVLYQYKEEMFDASGTIDGFMLNRDIVGTEMFLQKKDSLKYDSFIFGSSKTTAYLSADWDSLINNQSTPFHFIGSGESLYGIWSKFKFLERLNYPIGNALICFDSDLLNRTQDGDGIISIRHKATTQNFLHYHLVHLSEYMMTDFFIQYLTFKLTKTKRHFMDKLFNNDAHGLVFDNYKNDWIFGGKEKELAVNKEAFYEKRKDIFYERKQEGKSTPSVIQEKQRLMLEDIKNILLKYKTQYQIIIHPDYHQENMNPEDVDALKAIFSVNQIHDFSGINAVTTSKYNYYDNFHYTPKVGKEILKSIYSNF